MLICLTPENLSAPWLLFEAGALAKTLEKTFVCQYWLDLQYADIQDPLAQFQLTRADKEDTRKLLHMVNRAVARVADKHTLPEARFNVTFEKWWPDLENALQPIQPASSSVPQKRSNRELLEDILEVVRRLTRTANFYVQQELERSERAMREADARRLQAAAGIGPVRLTDLSPSIRLTDLSSPTGLADLRPSESERTWITALKALVQQLDEQKGEDNL